QGRLHILGIMNEHIAEARAELSDFAPRILTIKVHKDKIREVIGKGGETIRGIIERTGANLDIDNEGLVKISSVDLSSAQAALKEVELITAEVEVGQLYDGQVVKITDFGAFVRLLPGKDGLLHISQIAEERVNNVSDYLKEGQEITVKVVELDRQGRVKLTMKGLGEQQQA
ncbi:MAG: S1 RNA-binding domain-containing protein, partial [Gammaproteobacteria bacterium]|nr:S1 RNA-binding domain-containing protein [Gammaproteobacteria bacterium]